METAEEEVKAMLQRMQDAWNSGDFDAFMDCHSRSESVSLIFSGELTQGWNAIGELYKKIFDVGPRKGILDYNNVQIEMLSEEYSSVRAGWRLESLGRVLDGFFTILLEKEGEDWRISLDHSSHHKTPEEEA